MILRVLIKRHKKLLAKQKRNTEDENIKSQIYKIELIFTNLIWYWCVYKLRKFPYNLDTIIEMKKNIHCTVNENGELLYRYNPLKDKEPLYRNITPILARIQLQEEYINE